MGVYLAKPSTEKHSAQASSATLEYGASSMQGWRTSQEDAHCCHLDVDCSDMSLFGVFDGHGGSDISRFCADHLLATLQQLDSFKAGDMEKALEECFLALDRKLLEDAVKKQLMEVRQKADGVKNGQKGDDGDDASDSDAGSDVSGDDPDSLKAEAQMSMADLIAKIVKPKKGSPFIYKKSEKCAAGTSKLVSSDEGGSSSSPVTTAGGRKRAYCPAKKQATQPEMEKPGSSSSGVSSEGSEGKPTSETPDSKAKSSPNGLGSPPSEPEEKRPMMNGDNENNGEQVKPEHNSCSKEENGKCADGPLADCKQKLNHAGPKPTPAESTKDEGEEEEKEKEVEVQGEEEEEENSSVAAEDLEDEEEASSEEDSEEDNDDDDEDDDSSEDSDEVYREMMEDELANADDDDDDDDSDDGAQDDDGDEDFESRRARFKKLKALGLLGGAVLRRSILAASGEVDEDDDEEAEDEEENGDEDAENFGPLKVRGGPDIEFLSPSDERVPGVGSGATAIVALLKGTKLYVANAGDSRCILYQDGKTIPMSFDHKPDDAIELARIQKAGGRVTPDGRVMGGLNLSRAIGDHLYKRNSSLPLEEQMVTCKPDLKVIDVEPSAEFMVLACDGIWNSMTNEEVGDFVHDRLEKTSLTDICSQLFDHCLAPSTAGDGTGCDNMTAIIVRFLKDEKGAKICQAAQLSRPASKCDA